MENLKNLSISLSLPQDIRSSASKLDKKKATLEKATLVEELQKALKKGFPDADSALLSKIEKALLEPVLESAKDKKFDGKLNLEERLAGLPISPLECLEKLPDAAWDMLNRIAELQGQPISTICLPVGCGVIPQGIACLPALNQIEVPGPLSGVIDLKNIVPGNRSITMNVHNAGIFLRKIYAPQGSIVNCQQTKYPDNISVQFYDGDNQDQGNPVPVA